MEVSWGTAVGSTYDVLSYDGGEVEIAPNLSARSGRFVSRVAAAALAAIEGTDA
ncbi:MAG TPA: hypothetical protein VIR58_03765 [Acidimicrobiales bacterium]